MSSRRPTDCGDGEAIRKDDPAFSQEQAGSEAHDPLEKVLQLAPDAAVLKLHLPEQLVLPKRVDWDQVGPEAGHTT